MFVIAESATTVVRLDGRFDSQQARSLAEMFSMFQPVPHVVIDFANVREVDDCAVAGLARVLGAFPESRVTFRGLSRHLRRVLRYLGADLEGLSDGEPEGAAGEAEERGSPGRHAASPQAGGVAQTSPLRHTPVTCDA